MMSRFPGENLKKKLFIELLPFANLDFENVCNQYEGPSIIRELFVSNV